MGFTVFRGFLGKPALFGRLFVDVGAFDLALIHPYALSTAEPSGFGAVLPTLTLDHALFSLHIQSICGFPEKPFSQTNHA